MIVLNFAHPLTPAQLTEIEKLAGDRITEARDIATHFDHDRPFIDQVSELVESLDIDSTTWQTERILINPPTLNVIAVTLLAELHGRMGYLPPVLHLRSNDKPSPPYQVAGIIDLQEVRNRARAER